MHMPEDSNTHKAEDLEVEGPEDIWINIWNSAFQRYLTMKSWMLFNSTKMVACTDKWKHLTMS